MKNQMQCSVQGSGRLKHKLDWELAKGEISQNCGLPKDILQSVDQKIVEAHILMQCLDYGTIWMQQETQVLKL